MRAGLYRDRVIHWQHRSAKDSYGQNKPIYEQGETYWASVLDQTGAEVQDQGRLVSRVTTEIRLRNEPEIQPQDKLEDVATGTVYDIVPAVRGKNEIRFTAWPTVERFAKFYSLDGPAELDLDADGAILQASSFFFDGPSALRLQAADGIEIEEQLQTYTLDASAVLRLLGGRFPVDPETYTLDGPAELVVTEAGSHEAELVTVFDMGGAELRVSEAGSLNHVIVIITTMDQTAVLVVNEAGSLDWIDLVEWQLSGAAELVVTETGGSNHVQIIITTMSQPAELVVNEDGAHSLIPA